MQNQKFISGEKVWYAEKDRMKTAVTDKLSMHGGVESWTLNNGINRYAKELFPAEFHLVSIYNKDANELNVEVRWSESGALNYVRSMISDPFVQEADNLAKIVKWSQNEKTVITVFVAKTRR